MNKKITIGSRGSKLALIYAKIAKEHKSLENIVNQGGRYIALINQLEEYKEKGEIKKYGFSLYFTEHLEYLLENNISFDFIKSSIVTSFIIKIIHLIKI